MKRILNTFFLALALLGSMALQAQNKKQMAYYVEELNKLSELAFGAQTDNERFNANELYISLLNEALAEPKSFTFDWKDLKGVSVLKASDNKFKVFTWAIVRDEGEYDCFGFMQVLNEKTNEYDVYQLQDRSPEIYSAEDASLSYTNWYGVVYYDLIVKEWKGKNYYTLLGWSGNNLVKQRKVIETVYFKGSSTTPLFGQTLFYKEKNRRRIVFEYSKQTTMLLRYDKQYHVFVEKERGKNKPVEFVTHEEEKEMIVFDVLEPMHEGMTGVFQYYFPSGSESGYFFENGKWKLLENVKTASHEKQVKENKYKEKKRTFYKP